MIQSLLIISAIYIIICLIIYAYQEKFIFYPTKLKSDYKFPQYNNIEELYFQTEPKARIHTLFFKCAKPKGLILYFHGNTGALDRWGYWATLFTERQYDVIMPDYRNYGKSTGPFSEEAFYIDAAYIYNTINKRYSYPKIIIYGRSLGSGPATFLATKVKAHSLILETPYASMLRLIAMKIWFLPAKLLIRYKFENFARIKNVKCPVFILHGTDDELIPFSEAEYLAGTNIPFIVIPGGGHNNLSDFPIFQNKLSELLK